jgi:hypothetical protein
MGYPCASNSGKPMSRWFLVLSINSQLHTSSCQLAISWTIFSSVPSSLLKTQPKQLQVTTNTGLDNVGVITQKILNSIGLLYSLLSRMQHSVLLRLKCLWFHSLHHTLYHRVWGSLKLIQVSGNLPWYRVSPLAAACMDALSVNIFVCCSATQRMKSLFLLNVAVHYWVSGV